VPLVFRVIRGQQVLKVIQGLQDQQDSQEQLVLLVFRVIPEQLAHKEIQVLREYKV